MTKADGKAVSVDRDFARFGTKSYAINKINSVEVREDAPHGTGLPLVLGIIALVILLNVFIAFTTSSLIWFAVFAGAAYWAWQRSKKRLYNLYLMTSSSEAQALQSEDQNEVFALRDAIESAMAGR